MLIIKKNSEAFVKRFQGNVSLFVLVDAFISTYQNR